MDGKLSIVVPVYNAERYLEDCILSILNQSYKNIEIILINDGSTDNSENICSGLVKKYKNIKNIIKKQNVITLLFIFFFLLNKPATMIFLHLSRVYPKIF